jgi:hypothetical protein
VYGIGGAGYALAFAIGGLAVFDQLERRNRERVEAAAKATKPTKRAAKSKTAAKKAPAKKAATRSG